MQHNLTDNHSEDISSFGVKIIHSKTRWPVGRSSCPK